MFVALPIQVFLVHGKNSDLLLTTETPSTGDISAWLTSCSGTGTSFPNLPTAFDCPSELENHAENLTEIQSACNNDLTQMQQTSLHQAYLFALQQASQEYLSNYQNYCMEEQGLLARESFTMSYTLDEYHYTLFYYDQAGNLVKTVSPEGLFHKDMNTSVTVSSILTTTSNTVNTYTLADVAAHRANPTTAPFVHPNHTLVVNYKYSSLQQVSEQTTPDGGTTKYFYDYLGRLVISQDARQANLNKYSYVLYNAIGWIYQSGEIDQNSTLGAMTQAIAINPVQLNDWLSGTGAGARKEVTEVFYDSPLSTNVNTAFGAAGQTYLRNRVSSSTFEEVYDNNPATYDYASHFSYDLHGNVNHLIQEITELAIINQNFKHITYQYDLISGNVNQVNYQQGQYDEFYHRYFYDGNNRLKEVQTSRDGAIWERDANYFYYQTGALARTETGEKDVAGSDYYYTLQGWLKGLNSATLADNRDAGTDGRLQGVGQNQNEFFAKDALGFTLGYFKGDYKSIGTFAATDQFGITDPSNNPLINQNTSNLYNGNIGHIVTGIRSETGVAMPQAMVYQYDQLNRLKVAQLSTSFNSTNNTWNSSHTATNAYLENEIKYDGNGNIVKYKRYDNNGALMDDLVYQYNLDALGRLSNNQLRYVDDAVTTAGINSDIEDQANGNYTYDGSGRLKKDIKENIGNIGNDGITWTNTNKVKSIRRQGSGSEANIDYCYNNMGHKVKKVVKGRNAGAALGQDQWEYTYYVYDAAGNVMAIYDRNYNGLIGGNYADILTVSEQNIYGSSRLGQVKSNRSTTSNFTASYSTTDETGALYFTNLNYTTIGATGDGHTYTNNAQLFQRSLGKKEYELSNHLGNVNVVISDRKKSIDIASDGTTDYYLSEVKSYTDFYAFGSVKPGRVYQAEQYRFGFNGKEKSSEIAEGEIDFGARVYDSRIGRWLSCDKLQSEYPNLSPYVFVANMPIIAIDPDGERVFLVNGYYNNSPLIKNIVNKPHGGKDYWASSYLNKAEEFFGGVQTRGEISYIDGNQMGFAFGTGEANMAMGELYAIQNLEALTKGLAEGETISLMGHSMGAAFAAGMALVLERYHYKVENLVLMSAHDSQDIDLSAFQGNSYQIGEHNDLVVDSYDMVKGIDNFAVYNYTPEIMYAHGNPSQKPDQIFNVLTDLKNAKYVYHPSDAYLSNQDKFWSREKQTDGSLKKVHLYNLKNDPHFTRIYKKSESGHMRKTVNKGLGAAQNRLKRKSNKCKYRRGRRDLGRVKF